jgi:sugar phosphate isomerase/epimerase
MTFNLAAAEKTLPGTTLVEKYAFVRSVGFQGIELSAEGNGVFAARADELAAARERGVQMPSAVVAMDRFIGDLDADRRRDAIDELKQILSTLAIAGSRGLVSPHSYGLFSKRLPPFHPPRSDEESHRLLVDALRELGDHAAGCGTVLYLEPLNRYEDHMVNTLAQGAELCAAIGSPALRLLADTYHMNIEEDDPCVALREAAPWLGEIHLSDSNRHQPGTGHVPFADVLATLREAGIDAFLAVECRPRGDAEQALRDCGRYLRGLLGG